MVALVQRHGVELKKAGRNYVGRCPFHQEKSPSFTIWPEEKNFWCFGCQTGGDAISFLQRLLGKPFLDTVRDLAQELSIDLEGEADPATRERQQVKDATDFATQHFVNLLWDPVVGRAPREYLRGRGLSEEVMRTFGLGWAPLAWSNLADRLHEAGMLAFGEKAGLVAARQRGEGFYDTFRGRVIIPIRSPEGRTIAFGGRLLEGEDGPKYLNSRENRLYNKSEVLFGTDRAREEIRRRKSAVLCEGYFDCIGLHMAGVKHALALCSTAVTPGHLALLKRLEAKELVLLLDGDEAGRKAVERLAGVILASGESAKVALLPDGEDPDTFARKVGSEGVHELLQRAKPLTQHVFDSVLLGGSAASFEEKMTALQRLKPITSQLPVGLIRSAFFGSMSRHFDLPAQELEASLRPRVAPAVRSVPKTVAAPPKSPPPDQLEINLALCLLRDPKLLARDTYRVVDELKHTGIRALVGLIQTGSPPAEVLYEVPEALRDLIQKAMPPPADALEQEFLRVCRKLKIRSIDERRAALAATIGESMEPTEDTQARIEERRALLELRNSLNSPK